MIENEKERRRSEEQEKANYLFPRVGQPGGAVYVKRGQRGGLPLPRSHKGPNSRHRLNRPWLDARGSDPYVVGPVVSQNTKRLLTQTPLQEMKERCPNRWNAFTTSSASPLPSNLQLIWKCVHVYRTSSNAVIHGQNYHPMAGVYGLLPPDVSW